MPTAAKVLLSVGLLLLLFLSLVDGNSGNPAQRQRRRRRQLKVPGAVEMPPIDDFSALALQNCGRLFIDGGSNTGESVRAFVKGNFFTCGLHSPSRQYASSWGKLTRH